MFINNDRYIRRALQSWVSQYSVPSEGRAELLELAASQTREERRPLARLAELIQPRFRFDPYRFYPDRHIIPLEPFTLSTLWSYHLVTNQRLAT